ncbi:MAG: HAD hydrolase family protein, partial [Chlamydiales bacterium]
IPLLDSICRKHATDFVVYSGYENDDLCYYRTSYFSPDMFDYLMQRKKFLVEKWIELSSFHHLPVQVFTSLKCFAKGQQAEFLSLEIEDILGLHSPPIQDPFDAEYSIIQATHPSASKGSVLQEVVKAASFKGPVIAAGDDNNDVGMLEAAHIKIAMADAPPRLLAIADIIAPPASENGLIEGLSKALERLLK